MKDFVEESILTMELSSDSLKDYLCYFDLSCLYTCLNKEQQKIISKSIAAKVFSAVTFFFFLMSVGTFINLLIIFLLKIR